VSNFYCEGCQTVLCSHSDYGVVDGLPYCDKCYEEKIGAPAPADGSNKKGH
jgi:hypothetical protein